MSAFQVAFRNPDGLFTPRAFSQAATVTGKAKTIYIGGQNAVDADGHLVGRDDLAAQTRQVLKNIETILVSEGATFQDLVKLNVYLVQGADVRVGFEAFQEMVGPMAHMPLVTVLFVAGLGISAALVEIDGIAVVEDRG
jgi:enamine deaminase RidA (YjgF/YER057c/UK114 family)